MEGLIYSSDSANDPFSADDWNNLSNEFTNYFVFRLSFEGTIDQTKGFLESSFRTYIFKNVKSFITNFRPFLNPPFGDNIPSLLMSNQEFKELVSSVFKEKGFRLMIKPSENDINMAKDINDELYSYPYNSISETIQRIVFYMLAIESNKKAVLILDEPESNTFPMYTKQLAELIALDNSNQYFLATHDPYILGSLLSKSPSSEISVFITKMDNYETSVARIDKTKLSSILDQGMDIFFNLNKFLSE